MKKSAPAEIGNNTCIPSDHYPELNAVMGLISKGAPPKTHSMQVTNTCVLHIYADIQQRKTLLVCFGSGSRKAGRKPPVSFFGQGIVGVCDADVLCIPDITPQLHPDVNVGWHIGSPDTPLTPLYTQLLTPLVDGAYDHVIFIGSQGNGFAALYYAGLFPQVTCLVFDPHTTISSGDNTQVNAYIQAFYTKKQQNAALKSKKIGNIPFTITANTTELRAISCLVCVQNTADTEAVKHHIAPLAKALGGNTKAITQTLKNAHIIYESWGNKGQAAPVGLYAAYVKKITHGHLNVASYATPDAVNFLDIYAYRNMPEVFLGTPPNFQLDPFNDRSWRWAINSFLFFDNHLKHGKKITDTHIDYLNNIINHWLNCYRTAEPNDEFPWHDHATALRVDAVTKYYELLVSIDKITPDTKTTLTEFVLLNCQKLSQDSFYSEHTNHGFDQAIALFHGSAAFKLDQFIDLALTRYNAELAYAFTKEGVHVENSPGYHKGMITNVLRSLDIIKRFNYGDRLLFDLDTFSNNAVDFLMYAMRYDYVLPYIGDTESYGIHIDLPNTDNLKNYGLYKALCQRKSIEKDSLSTIKLYKDAGYFFYRSDWSNIKESTHIVLKSSYLSHYHRQDDDLNLLLSAHGEDWFMDSGLYSYNKQDPIRKYMRSAKAHNVPMFEGKRILRDISLKDTDNGVRMMDTPDGAICEVIAKTHMYENIHVRRRLTITDANHIACRDFISQQTTQPAHWLFHIPADKTVVFEESVVRITGKYATLLLRPNFVAYDKNRKKISSSYEGALYKGWNKTFPSVFSPKRGAKEDTQVIVLTCHKVDFVHFDITLEKHSI